MCSFLTDLDKNVSWKEQRVQINSELSKSVKIKIKVYVVPFFGGQRRQLSPWHHFVIGTVDRGPSAHWTASPDTLLSDSVETEHTQPETHLLSHILLICFLQHCKNVIYLCFKRQTCTVLPVCCLWSWSRAVPFLTWHRHRPALTLYCSAQCWRGWQGRPAWEKPWQLRHHGGRSY